MSDEKKKILDGMSKGKLVAIMTLYSNEETIPLAEALLKAGINILEVTFRTEFAKSAIMNLKKHFKDKIIIGAGTLLDENTAKEAIDAGASFLVSPYLNFELIRLCNENSKIAIPGCLTPTEVYTAYKQGADIIKIYPARIGGAKYIKELLTVYPGIKIMPTGGINTENAAEYIKNGAFAIGAGGELIDKNLVKEKKWDLITAKAKEFVDSINR